MRCALNRILLASALLASIAAGQVSYPFPGRVLDRQPLDAQRSAVLTDTGTPGSGRFGLYIVSNKDNRELLALAADSEGAFAAWPVLEVIKPNSVYLHFHSDYGIYEGSIKYFLNFSSTTPSAKIRYDVAVLKSDLRDGSKLRYESSFGQKRATIVIEPRDSQLPSYHIIDEGPALEPAVPQPNAFRGPGGEVVTVQNTTQPGQPQRPSVIFVDNKPFPAPIPTVHFYRQTLPQKGPPGEMESDIGPFVQSGDKIWFATTFYDGEGVSGIGAIGSFDIASRKYEMRYLPEIAPWSGSAMLLDGDDLWIGLKRRPEGADIGGGLLRYGIATGTLQNFAIPDVIFTIDRVGDALYCGTSNGLYMLRADQITQLRFEPSETGQLVMVARDVPPQATVQPNAR